MSRVCQKQLVQQEYINYTHFTADDHDRKYKKETHVQPMKNRIYDSVLLLFHKKEK